MNIGSREAEFLWNLLLRNLLGRVSQDEHDPYSVMIENNFELPSELCSMLAEYSSSNSREVLLNLAEMAVQEFIFEPKKHIKLVSLLVEEGVIDIKHAAMVLGRQLNESVEISDDVRNVFNVMWLINQDLQHGVMGPDQDSLLREALHKVFTNIK